MPCPRIGSLQDFRYSRPLIFSIILAIMFTSPHVIACIVLLAVLNTSEASNAPTRQLLSMRTRGRNLVVQRQSGFRFCKRFQWGDQVSGRVPKSTSIDGTNPEIFSHTKRDKNGDSYMFDCMQDCENNYPDGGCRAAIRRKVAKSNNGKKDDQCNLRLQIDYLENGQVDDQEYSDHDYFIKVCDECAIAANPCQHEGTCVYGEYSNSFKCNCPTEAEGSDCENCVAGFTSNGARCDANACLPTEIPHSKNKAVNDSVTGVTGEEVDIVCDDGFTSSLTSSKIQCQSNGDFTSMSCDPGKDPPQPLAF